MNLPATKARVRLGIPSVYIDDEGKRKFTELSHNGYLVLEIDKDERRQVKEFFKELVGKGSWREIAFNVTLERWYKRKTYDQVKLIWALLSILSWVEFQEFGHETTLYADMLDAAGPGEVSPLSGVRRPTKTLSGMNTKEAAVCANWLFDHLLEAGEMVPDPASIKKWWREWAAFRFAKHDPLIEAFKDVDEYRHKVRYCEACMKFLDPEADGYDGQMAHIVTKGSGGPMDLWNMLHLCHVHHIMVQHAKGWLALLADFPHLWPKVQRARELAGVGPLIDPGTGAPRLLEENEDVGE